MIAISPFLWGPEFQKNTTRYTFTISQVGVKNKPDYWEHTFQTDKTAGIPNPAGPAAKQSIAQRASRLAGTLSGKQGEQSRPGLNFTLETDSEGDDSVKSVPRTASDEEERTKASKSSNTKRCGTLTSPKSMDSRFN